MHQRSVLVLKYFLSFSPFSLCFLFHSGKNFELVKAYLEEGCPTGVQNTKTGIVALLL
jgi:hypothetical protein